MYSLSDCRIINLPKIADPRGNLTFIEPMKHVPFEFKRIFYLYDVPGGETRGGHANKTTHQFIIAGSGSFDVKLDDGFSTQSYHLNRAYYGLYVPPMIWRELSDFSSGAFCIVLASERYDPNDYIRDYEEYKRAIIIGRDKYAKNEG